MNIGPLPSLCRTKAIRPRSTSTAACWSSSSTAFSTVVSRAAAVSVAPASRCARTAASVRSTRSVVSSDNAAARSMNAAAAVTPPRDRAREAERSSSAATSSSGPVPACARCQARRSGSTTGSVTSASTRWAAKRSCGSAAR